LLWKDRRNYLRLTRGLAGAGEITLAGCIANDDLFFGRGQIKTSSSQPVFLQLERTGSNVSAFCSADGTEWFAVGHSTFPVQDPIDIGLFATGHIARDIYNGAYPQGTAMRFESFHVRSR
jgi:hypothetical protein